MIKEHETIAKKDITNRTAFALQSKLSKIKGSVYLRKDNRTICVGSLLGLLSLSVKSGDTVHVSFIEENAEDIVKEFCEMI